MIPASVGGVQRVVSHLASCRARNRAFLLGGQSSLLWILAHLSQSTTVDPAGFGGTVNNANVANEVEFYAGPHFSFFPQSTAGGRYIGGLSVRGKSFTRRDFYYETSERTIMFRFTIIDSCSIAILN